MNLENINAQKSGIRCLSSNYMCTRQLGTRIVQVGTWANQTDTRLIGYPNFLLPEYLGIRLTTKKI